MLIFIKGRHCKPPELIKNTVELIRAASIYYSQNRLYGYQTPMLGKASGYKQRLLAEKFVKPPFLVSNRNTSVLRVSSRRRCVVCFIRSINVVLI